jgi:uncharacterized protein YdeI (BOF family)
MTQKINSESDKLKTKFYLGQKVKVCGDLETVIKRIDGDKYFFCDETGREWSEVADAIEANAKLN